MQDPDRIYNENPLPKWQMDLIDERFEMLKNNPDDNLPIELLFDAE